MASNKKLTQCSASQISSPGILETIILSSSTRSQLTRCMGSMDHTSHHWCALPTKNAHVTYSPYILPEYLYLDLPKHIVCDVARFSLCVHTLKVEQAPWNDAISPTCDLCGAQDDVQDEQHIVFKCTHTQYASSFSGPLLPLSHPSPQMAPYQPAIHHVQSFDMLSFTIQYNNRLHSFLHELRSRLLLSHEQASSNLRVETSLWQEHTSECEVLPKRTKNMPCYFILAFLCVLFGLLHICYLKERKKERLRLPSLAACIKEKSPERLKEKSPERPHHTDQEEEVAQKSTPA
eukprot:124303-Pelagomonas_calceolata.AAC.1